ncbi:hypothetical protein LSAT2_031075 [Lamellibrachia satsuma]|nr:hypothetical protein LSAT2_031075 [Lamellibrachia satsuma]
MSTHFFLISASGRVEQPQADTAVAIITHSAIFLLFETTEEITSLELEEPRTVTVSVQTDAKHFTSVSSNDEEVLEVMEEMIEVMEEDAGDNSEQEEYPDSEECNRYDFTTTSEVSDLEEEPSKRKPKKKLYKDCITDSLLNESDSDQEIILKNRNQSCSKASLPTPPMKLVWSETKSPEQAHYGSQSDCSELPSWSSYDHDHDRRWSTSTPMNRKRSRLPSASPSQMQRSRNVTFLFFIEGMMIATVINCTEDASIHLNYTNATRGCLHLLHRNHQSHLVTAHRITQLAKIGGINVKDNARKVMQRLLTNDVMALMNMHGNRGKTAFANTKLHGIVKASVLKNQTGTETDIDSAVSACLKYAPDRVGGGRSHKTG